MDGTSNKTIFSGIQPSGTPHLGNYLGALQQWAKLQEGNTTYYCVVDHHAITVPYEPAELDKRILDTVAINIAVGIDPEESIVFVQSHVPAHTELGWILSTTTPMGELSRMTQYKQKSDAQRGESSLGLFAYPVLQAADILLYHTDAVPVGEDQVQHIELTRDIAKRFNNRFGDVFSLPEARVTKSAARIMSLSNPEDKMSKSGDEKSAITLTDEPDVIRRKIGSAVTDTDPIFSFTNSGPAVKNLLTMYRALSEQDEAAIEKQFEGSGYKEFKEALADLVVEKLTPIRERFHEIREDEGDLRIMLARNAQRAAEVANRTLGEVKEKMGLR